MQKTSFKRISILKRLTMPVSSLETYYRERRKYLFAQGTKLRHIRSRKALYPLFSAFLKIGRCFQKQTIQVLGEPRKDYGQAIFACTHIDSGDLERIYEVLGQSCWWFVGDPCILYKDISGLLLYINGSIFLETLDKIDRHIAYLRAVELLKGGGSLMIFPEGARNGSENRPILPLFQGTAKMAMEAHVKIVPVGIERYDRRFVIKFGQALLPEDYTGHEALTQALRDSMATLKWDIWEREGVASRSALLPSIGYGISMLHYQTCAGKYVYLIPELISTSFAEALCKLRPDNFAGGPIHYINLRDSEEFKSGKLPAFKNLVSGGASLPKDVETALNHVTDGYEEYGVNEGLVVRQGYGLSENVAMGTYSRRGAYKFGSIGIPVPYVEVAIFETDTDKEVKYNELGEICITGPSIMQGYLNAPQETERVILTHSDGRRWIHTKDIGYMDEKGHVFLIDRAKNIFMRMGFIVHPATVAEFINSFSFIKNCVVIGFEHPAEQCVPVAFLEVGHSDIPHKKIIKTLEKCCRASLEETSVPYAFVIVDALPINAGGKIDIQRIRQMSGIDFYISDTAPGELTFS